MPCKQEGSIKSGVLEELLKEVILAPMLLSGSITLAIGLFCIDSSPFKDEEKCCAESIPESSLTVVPLFPQ